MPRAGESLEDVCRVCKTDRMHTVVAVDAGGVPLRVVCGYCRSEHQYRGGAQIAVARDREAPAAPARSPASRPTGAHDPFPLVSERERTAPVMSTGSHDIEMLLRRIIREEAGISPAAPADRWRGGSLVLRPGNGSQEKSWPIETFFHKIVMLRNRLRTLEQQVNAADLPEDAKIKMQGYISGCYGSLTSFNVLFAEDDDQFTGSGGGD
jgi:hypothetical protein